MRTVFLAILFAQAISTASYSQILNGFEIIPSAPTTEDTVKLVYDFWTASGAVYQSDTVIVDGFNIDVSSCVYLGLTTEAVYFLDTIVIGGLPPGSYNVSYTCNFTETANCSYSEYSEFDTTSFTVLPSLSTQSSKRIHYTIRIENNQIILEDFRVYPENTEIYLIDLFGRIVFNSDIHSNHIELPYLSNNTYLVYLVDSSGIIDIQKICPIAN